MCGIAGCSGGKRGIKSVMNILTRLEYRGYDSSGIAYVENNDLCVIKSLGNLQCLRREVSENTNVDTVIGHTRWATHGKPSIQNAHPHLDASGRLALVHNGIIENYQLLRSGLSKQGILCNTETDTEVIAKLIGAAIVEKEETGAIINAKTVLTVLAKQLGFMKGSYAIAFLFRPLPNYIFFAKNGSPLVVGQGQCATFLASDENAIKENCTGVLRLKDGDIGYINYENICIYDKKLNKKKVHLSKIDQDVEAFNLSGYSSFLNKEIAEGIGGALKTLRRAKKEIASTLPDNIFLTDFDLHITACGTALHAGRIAKYLIERELRMPVSIDFASEFKYKKPILSSKSICIFLSQSGETADTLGCVELAKSCGATTIGITNVKGSRIAEAVDYCLYTYAGVEISVASTKAYLAQLALIYALVFYLAGVKGKKLSFSLHDITYILHRLENRNYLSSLNKYLNLIKQQSSLYFVGRGIDYFVAMEGALKLKEICYIHCEAFAGGELKHGSLALINDSSVVVAILTQKSLIDKMLNNIHELNSRGAKVILLTPFTKLAPEVFGLIKLERCRDMVSPFCSIKPLQELTLYVAQKKGIDPDKPRNLAKSVTVE